MHWSQKDSQPIKSDYKFSYKNVLASLSGKANERLVTITAKKRIICLFYKENCQNSTFVAIAHAMKQATHTDSSLLSRKQVWARYGVLLPVIIVIFDQLTKFGAVRFFDKTMNYCELTPYQKMTHDTTPIVDMALLCNQGISWGLLQGDSPLKRWLLTIFAFGMSAMLFWMLGQTRDKLSRWALGLGLLIGSFLTRDEDSTKTAKTDK